MSSHRDRVPTAPNGTAHRALQIADLVANTSATGMPGGRVCCRACRACPAACEDCRLAQEAYRRLAAAKLAKQGVDAPQIARALNARTATIAAWLAARRRGRSAARAGPGDGMATATGTAVVLAARALWQWAANTTGASGAMGPTTPQMSLFADDTTTPTAPAGTTGGGCAVCAGLDGALCGACARKRAQRRRRRVVKLIEAGYSVSQAARELGVDRKTIRRDLAEERHERELALYTSPAKIPNAPIREAVARAMAADPALTLSEIARRGGFADASHVARLLGEIRTSDTVKRGKLYPGRLVTEISPHNAARIVRAIDMDPIDFDGL